MGISWCKSCDCAITDLDKHRGHCIEKWHDSAVDDLFKEQYSEESLKGWRAPDFFLLDNKIKKCNICYFKNHEKCKKCKYGEIVLNNMALRDSRWVEEKLKDGKHILINGKICLKQLKVDEEW